ncbi:SMI1/KNR4 family protein [Xanthocytophaga agilis]|uniref:SMI1/KNR4 family protein n=1 Tax=Xanthocytophaga agilis TaxID=3048010 RepID=A0AAE3R7R8_9BACT|nr:SMI1/KNR4 family protein [Xanthocytophaga agilis]MDJ1504770.1 SMI1/KNR4 family protein [Xanthocytophaga agilis]
MNALDIHINLLIDYWKKQNIRIIPRTIAEIEDIEKTNKIVLPDDLKKLYSRVNGMDIRYSIDYDEQGFSFYPIEDIISSTMKFPGHILAEKKSLYVFADYLTASWWYGVEVKADNKYTIGIIPHRDEFKPITDSLSEFIELYIADSPQLYDV